MITSIKNKLLPITKKSQLLGRWCIKDCKTKEAISVFWTNTDHCGDIVCGDMERNKKLLDDLIKKNKLIDEMLEKSKLIDEMLEKNKLK